MIAAPASAAAIRVPESLDDLRSHDLLGQLQQFGLNLLGALAILVVGVWIARRLANVLDRAFTRANMEATLRGFLRNIAYAAMLVVVCTSALFAVGVPPASVLAVVGAAGLAIGLALKDSLSNIASGVMLIMQRPFRVGDYVQVAGQEGTVEQIRVFQTRMHTGDNRIVVLPNSLITTAPITNFTANDRRRVDLVLGLAYEDDLQLARGALLSIARAHPKVLSDPAPEVLVTALGETRISLELRVWTHTADQQRVRSDLNEAVRMQVMGHGVRLPRRRLDVYHFDAAGRPLPDGTRQAIADDEATRGG